MQQARADAPGKGVAHAGQQRQPGPKRIAGGGVGVNGKGVQEQIGQTMPGKVVVARYARRKYHSFRRNPACCRLATKVQYRIWIVGQQPEDAVWTGLQQSHPKIENLRRNLVVVVEATKYEPRFRQFHVGAGGHRSWNLTSRVVA